MKKVVNSLKYLKLSDIFSPFIFVGAFVCSLFFRFINKIKKRNLWLICEGKVEARDNGYHFFKYIREKHPEEFCFYVIDKKSDGYKKIAKYGNIIQYHSFKHWIYYLSAQYNISSQKAANPNQILFYIIHVVFGWYKNRVFLQHGITVSNGIWLYYKNTKFRYFICGAKQEYEFIKEKFGYPEENVIYTGFPRFDNLYNNKVNEKQILIMPTWRNWLGRETNSLSEKTNFKETDFYNNWNGLLNNNKFINFIEKNNYSVLFYPHINMQKYLNDFQIKSKNIKLVDTKTDIQTVLKESAIMITDYSSVFMDFSYMLKPVVFFQFDYNEYRKKQYQEGYYDYKKNGFGPTAENIDEIVANLIKISENGVDEDYIDRMKKFFELKDNKNCERIYDKLKKGEKYE